MSSVQAEIGAFQPEPETDDDDTPDLPKTDTDTETVTDPDTDTDLEFDPESLSAADEDYQRAAVLKHYHNERGYAATEIAREVFNDEISDETIRNWLEEHDLKATSGSLMSLSKNTDVEPLVKLGMHARENGDSMIETSLDELLEKYGDKVLKETALE